MYKAFLNELKLESTKTLSEDSKDEELWIAIDDLGEILGFVSYYPPDNFLHHFYVRPDSRLNKVGTRILKYLQGEYGLCMKLKCLVSNHGALAFYKRIGFETCDAGQSNDCSYQLLAIDIPISG